MSISVIIPALNEQDAIKASVERAWKAGVDEVIVADGGSCDRTVEFACSCRCQVVSAPVGRGSQMNAGAAVASGAVLLFLHADNWLAESAAEQVRRASERSEFCWGGFQQRIEDSGKVFRWIEAGNALRTRCQRLVYGDQGMFVDRRVFESIGGFSMLPLMEDFELSRRLAAHRSPVLLPGPVHVSSRRWQTTGVIRQTFRNWGIATAYRLGVSPHRLARWYEA